MKNISLVILFIFNISLTGQSLKINYKTNSEKFVERSNNLYYENKLFTGVLFENLSNESPKYLFNYKNGKKNGLQKKFNQDNGKIESIINYKNGVTEGEFFHYYENGNIRSKGLVLHDERGEIVTFEDYYENGNLKSTGKQINKNRVGPFSWYYENGKLERKGNYTEGYGNFYSEEYYENGVLIGKGYYELGLKNGKWEIHYENGKLKERGEYKHGIKNGWFTEWLDLPEGKIDYSEGMYKNGERKGIWNHFFDKYTQKTNYGL